MEKRAYRETSYTPADFPLQWTPFYPATLFALEPAI